MAIFMFLPLSFDCNNWTFPPQLCEGPEKKHIPSHGRYPEILCCIPSHILHNVVLQEHEVKLCGGCGRLTANISLFVVWCVMYFRSILYH